MNKLVLLLIGGVVVVAGGFVIWMNSDDDNNVKVTDSSGSTQDVKTGDNALIAVDACDILTEAVAKQILGDGATKADTSAGNTSNEYVSVSNCNYTVEIVPGAVKPNNTKGLSVLARAAKTQSEADNNKSIFTSNKPAGAQDVSGVGDKAFFNPAVYQLNVLKGGNWYILTNYSGSTTNSTLESTKILADALSFR